LDGRLNDDIMKKKYTYNAAIYRRGSDDWSWHGEVVAYTKKDAFNYHRLKPVDCYDDSNVSVEYPKSR